MKVFQHERQLRTTGGLAVRDITEEVTEAVRESGVVDGIGCGCGQFVRQRIGRKGRKAGAASKQ